MPKPVYVAGPLFSQAERTFLEHMVDTLARAADLDPEADFFLPHRDSGEFGKHFDRKGIFDLDMRELESASTIVALLDGPDVDSGTCIELGYAHAKGKKIFGLITDFRALNADPRQERPNLMVWGVCEEGNTLHSSLDSLAPAFAQHLRENPL